jgi:hypothetical protein
VKVQDWKVNEGFPSEHKEYAVVCGNCGAFGPNDLGWSGAEEQWNTRRNLEAETKELMEAAEAALKLANAMNEGDLYDQIKNAITKARGSK